MNPECLVEGPLTPGSIAAVLKRFSEDKLAGGQSLFLGQVRADESGGRKVRAIEYSAYAPMAGAEAEKIIRVLREKYPDVRAVVILHSTGRVEAGETSLLVAVSAGHRKAAIEACSDAVEQIKQKLPVWKKEIFDDESETWK